MIYRYIGFNNKKREKILAIKNNQLWMSSPADFNDPFDCNFPIHTNPSEDDLRNLVELGAERLGKSAPSLNKFNSASDCEKKYLFQHIEKQYQESINSTGICCFSELWNSILMWSHYSDKHQGICLGYDDTEFTKDYPDILNKVRYSTHYPDVSLCEITKDINKMLEKYLLTKHVDWRYEQERRLISLEPNSCRKLIPSPFPLREVLIGFKTDRRILKLIIDCFGDKVDCYRAYRASTGEYGLQRKKL